MIRCSLVACIRQLQIVSCCPKGVQGPLMRLHRNTELLTAFKLEAVGLAATYGARNCSLSRSHAVRFVGAFLGDPLGGAFFAFV